MTKYIFVTGGVVSSIGKGIVASSIGCLLKNKGLKVTIQKFDPYINIDPGTMSPYQHGEVFVTDDGAETDLDLGHYERFIDVNLNKYSNVTTGKIYSEIIRKERKGEFLGATVQVIPHITNEIKDQITRAASITNSDVIITEIGGTVGDIESLPFLEAIRQMKTDFGADNVLYVHTTLVPYLKAAGEIKTKPTQHSVKELRGIGIQPNILVVRTERAISQEAKNKLAQFCDVDREAVIESRDAKTIYSVPLRLQEQGLDRVICKYLQIDAPETDMTEWIELEKRILSLKKKVKIAMVGKYVELTDAYLSLIEGLKHAGIPLGTEVDIQWVKAQDLTKDNVDDQLKEADGVLVPGGFGLRGIEGKMIAIEYARNNDIPFLGICLGMQLACVEFARNVIKLEDADTAETAPATKHNIIDLMPDQENVTDLGGTLRLGLYPCKIKEDTVTAKAYDNKPLVQERHRHRYEFNNKYREIFEENGMVFSGVSPDNRLVEIIELKDKKFFVGCQFHPELISRPNRPQKLIYAFVKASCENKEKN